GLEAARAVKEVKVMYEPLPVINSPGEALEEGATLVHPDLANYRRTKECFPVPGTNIASHVKIRKGDMNSGWSQSEVTVEASFFLPQADHVALETRATRLKINPQGFVTIHSTSQGPYIIRKKLSRHFKIDVGKITVYTPLVGGAFGGKAAVQLEMIALLASRAVGGKEVLLVNSRKED